MSSRDDHLDRLMWQRIHWPQPLGDVQAVGLLRSWAAQIHAPLIVLEARADRTGVQYLVGTQRRHAAAVRRDIEQLVQDALVVEADDDRLPAASAGRVAFSPAVQPLQVYQADNSTRTILAALTAVTGSERIVVQVVLGPRIAPRLTPKDQPEVDQGLVSLLTTGVRPERRTEVRHNVALKRAEPGFAAIVRLGVHAGDEARALNLVRGVVNAFRSLSAPGVHFSFRPERPARINQPSNTWPLLTPTGQHLTVTEVGRLSAWPTASTDAVYPGQPPAHPRPIRPSFAASTGDRIVAESTAPGTEHTSLGVSVGDSTRHLWLMGPTGVGKSSLLLNLLIADMKAGRALVVIEPKDLIGDLLRHIPADRVDDVVLVDPLDEAPVGVNPLDRHGRSPELVADQLYGTFRALYGDQLGPRSSDILRHALAALAQTEGASLAQLPLLLGNRSFRERIVQPIAAADPISAGPFWHWFDQLSPDAAAQVVSPLMNKVRPLLTRHLRRILAQPEPRFNIRQVLTEQKILLVPLQKGVIGPEAAQLLGALVVAELWQAIQERAAITVRDRQVVSVVLDEVQEYLRLPTDLSDALATSRSLGVAFHVAHQYLDQLPQSMRTAFEANCRSRVFFQLASRDAKAAATMAPGLEAEDFMALPARHVYAQLVRRGAVTDWASGRTLDTPPAMSSPDMIRRASQTNYGTRASTVDQQLHDVATSTITSTSDTTKRRRTQS
ncbi:type IV secretory system conjugative DNA transfer family protein [Pseudarthrobacter sp. NIBRBAC000502771]|uniref:type IV secretory system conjugative DNA transfer family protein n=1 Tax=Pseudarthrobacter sp. NIBRBAC000502771 TaxID=2590774 RepID=UPI001130BB20|nr:type IV secretion system DNA-binding domain-containing protein [Pseudarthrobacter sp. NIBRBAC000502771]QDG64008.1 type IV secretory system conjugative DNA transfer family protein [Pseudarthrobacter sp. NIBRBAC000502771]